MILVRRISAALLVLFAINCLAGTVELIHDVHQKRAILGHTRIVAGMPGSVWLGLAIVSVLAMGAFLAYPWNRQPSPLPKGGSR